jgi:hypothetical protein
MFEINRRALFPWLFAASVALPLAVREIVTFATAKEPAQKSLKKPVKKVVKKTGSNHAELVRIFTKANPEGKTVHSTVPEDQPVEIASLAKLGVMRLALEKIKDEKIDIDERKITVSQIVAQAPAEYGHVLHANEKPTVREALYLGYNASKNDAAILLAEFAAGSEAAALKKILALAQAKDSPYKGFAPKNVHGHPGNDPNNRQDSMATLKSIIGLYREMELKYLDQLKQIGGKIWFTVPSIPRLNRPFRSTTAIKYYNSAQPNIFMDCKTGSDNSGPRGQGITRVLAMVKLDANTTYYCYLKRDKGTKPTVAMARLIKEQLTKDRDELKKNGIDLSDKRYDGLHAHLRSCIDGTIFLNTKPGEKVRKRVVRKLKDKAPPADKPASPPPSPAPAATQKAAPPPVKKPLSPPGTAPTKPAPKGSEWLFQNPKN